MRLALTCAGLALVVSLAPPTSGQAAAKLEIIASASGEAAAPWVLRQLCRKSTGRCEMALMNPETGEVARMGLILGADFELTGNSQEIRRAETAMQKAIRLRRG